MKNTLLSLVAVLGFNAHAVLKDCPAIKGAALTLGPKIRVDIQAKYLEIVSGDDGYVTPETRYDGGDLRVVTKSKPGEVPVGQYLEYVGTSPEDNSGFRFLIAPAVLQTPGTFVLYVTNLSNDNVEGSADAEYNCHDVK